MRWFVALFLASIFMLTTGKMATACKNDREVKYSEVEFKSLYNEQDPQTDYVPEDSPEGNRTAPFVLLGIGTILLLGGGAVCLKGGRHS